MQVVIRRLAIYFLIDPSGESPFLAQVLHLARRKALIRGSPSRLHDSSQRFQASGDTRSERAGLRCRRLAKDYRRPCCCMRRRVGSIGQRDLALKSLIIQKCGITSPRDFQIKHGLDLVRGKDLFLVVAPGMGKTVVMAAPLLAAQAAGTQGIALVVVPSKILTEQQVNNRLPSAVPSEYIN